MTSLLVVLSVWVLVSGLAAVGFCALLTGARLIDQGHLAHGRAVPQPRDASPC
jgi:hypothetical protein